MPDKNNASDILLAVGSRLELLTKGRPCELIDEKSCPDEYADIVHSLNKLIKDIGEMKEAIQQLVNGNPSAAHPSRGNHLAAPIKQLQSQLATLEHNASQLVKGKPSSKLHMQGSLYQTYNALSNMISGLTASYETEAQIVNAGNCGHILPALDKIHASIIETDMTGYVVYANKPARMFLGELETINNPPPGEENTAVLQFLSKAIASNSNSYPYFTQIHEPATDRWYEASIDKLFLPDGQEFFVHMIDDVTDRTRHEEKLSKTASTDSLTQVLNLRAGLNAIDELLKAANPKEVNCIVFIDLDNLKTVNDSFGHKEGDFFIKAAASAIVSSIRKSDIVARYGGDEFFIFFKKCTIESSEKRITQIKKKLLQTKTQLGLSYEMDFSYGTYEFRTADEIDISEVINKADKLMYQKKNRSR